MKTTCPLAVWSLVLGIVSIFFCGPFAAIPAIICGHMAKARINSDPERLSGNEMAIAGLVMGYFSIVVAVLMVMLLIVAVITIPSAITLFQNMTNAVNVTTNSIGR